VSRAAVPEVVRNKAIVHGATAWLDSLDDLIADLEADWGFRTEEPFGDGTEAYTTAATLSDGTAAVLKLIVPRAGDAARHEITVLELAGGDGCAPLLRADVDRGALLMPRLGPSMHDLRLPIAQRHDVLARLAGRVWLPAPDCGLPTGADKARWLIDFITSEWEATGRPCTERAVAHAVECAERRLAAHDDERAVLVHGDVHEWNALSAPDEPDGFLLVDPDGLLAEPEYDLGVIMREDPVELLDGDPRDRSRRLASLTGRDEVAIWEWGVVERVSTGLLCSRVGLQPAGAQMLHAADIVASPPR
jgi:streptomycin 6-kinase